MSQNFLAKTQVLGAQVDFVEQKFRSPLKISSGMIEVITEARVSVRVRVGATEAEGMGSMYLSDLWAWPDPALSHEVRDTQLRELCRRFAKNLPSLCGEAAHPLELGLRLHEKTIKEESCAPSLAIAMCASPFDAAIHDAAGQALKQSAFSFYREDFAVPETDSFFSNGTCTAIRRLLRQPAKELPGWWLVSYHDDLDKSFTEAVKGFGYGCFKIKLLGKDNAQDVARTITVYRAAKKYGVSRPRLSCDTNEGNPDAESVLDYLIKLEAEDKETYDALAYLEQPTGRDIRIAAFDWRPIAAKKPVLLDEGLTSLQLLPLVLEQGWSGLALKTCKGHSFALAAAAWAHEHGLVLALQDLTNPGYAAIHSYLMAAHLPVINGVELNSPQFTPSANASWLPRLRTLFQPNNGLHKLDPADTPGLGSAL